MIDCSTWLGNRNEVHLDAESSSSTTPKRSPNNAKAVPHQHEAVRHQREAVSQQRRSGSPEVLKAVHQQRQKQFTGNTQNSRLLATVSYKVSIQALPSSMALRPATRNRQSSAKSPTPESIRTLNAEALRLHLDRHNLVTTDRRQELVERLLQWYAASHQDSETNSQEGGSESDPELEHTRTVPGSQDNSSSSDRGNDDGQANRQADSLSKEARGQHPRHPNPRRQHHSITSVMEGTPAGVTGNPIRAYTDPGGSDPLAESIRRIGSASGSDPPPDQFH